ncbi:lysylphosphatidylglycerol synthase domain-containing protein [Mesorhizobium sp.]|uniref:lysylphosphatidylglycerol synthase domain-containing protein n=1 Tax=Mesorhizobium sp. TaxID=1871066 RepID=UPI0025DB4231|nr:lysylphosphatidylglycerol synthase domain-containing protein [Mesorhizobium sp.]
MKALRIVGIALSLAGLVFFIAAFARSPEVLIQAAVAPFFWSSLLIGTAAIFCSLLLAAFNWHMLLGVFGAGRTLALVGPVFLSTQIGKYLPGNVGHLIGRAVMLKSYEISVGASTKAMIVETMALLCVGFALAAMLLHEWVVKALQVMGDSMWLAIVLLSIAVVAMATTLAFRGRTAPFIRQLLADLAASRSRLLVVGAIDLVNFALNGLALWSAAALLFPDRQIGMLACLGVASASFLAGYITPGSPGGIGVREATTVLLLNPVFSATEAAMLALLIRLAATLADLIGFALGIALLALRGNRIVLRD